MSVVDDVNRELRDFNRYEGDGLNPPAVGALPVGDPRSGEFAPRKRGLRELLLTTLQATGNPEALEDILSEVRSKVSKDDVALIEADIEGITTEIDGKVSREEFSLILGSVQKVEHVVGSSVQGQALGASTDMRSPNALLTESGELVSVALRASGAITGEVHILSPRAGGETKTEAIIPFSRAGSGEFSVPLSGTYPAGTRLGIKTLTGAPLVYSTTPPNAGWKFWPASASVAVGDIQPEGTNFGGGTISALITYLKADGGSITSRIESVEDQIVCLEPVVTASAAYIGSQDIDYDRPVSIGSLVGGNSVVNNLNGYGLAEESPGGWLSVVAVNYSAAGAATIEVLDASGVVIAIHPIAISGAGSVGFMAGTDFPETFVPMGGLVYIRRISGGGLRFSASGGEAISTAGFEQANQVGQKQEVASSSVNLGLTIEYLALSRTLKSDYPILSPTLIDDRFENPEAWSLASAEISEGKLQSIAGSGWESRSFIRDYPYSQLMRRTLAAEVTFAAGNQIAGIGFIRGTDGFQLNTPAAIVDGLDGALKIYDWNSAANTAPPLRFTDNIPWPVAGSRMKLSIVREAFKATVTLTNMLTMQTVVRVMDYVAGTGGNTGRPWGRPCIIMPSVSTGGVIFTNFRMVADRPFPSASGAKVIVLGDSNAEGSQIGPDYEKAWPFLLEKEREQEGVKDVAIAARGGQMPAGGVSGMREAVTLAKRDTVVVIALGTNEAVRVGTLDAFRAAVASVISIARTRTDRIAICTLPPLSGSAANIDQQKALRRLINEDIIGGYFPDLLPPVRFDLALSLNNDGENWAAGMQTGDGIHISVAGQAVAFQRLKIDLPSVFE